jgi:hypothetical protein
MREAMEAYLSERCSGPACSDPMHARFRAALALPETTPDHASEETAIVWSEPDALGFRRGRCGQCGATWSFIPGDAYRDSITIRHRCGDQYPPPAPAPEETTLATLERLAGKWGVYLAAPDGYLDAEHLRLALEEAYRLGAASRPAPSEPAPEMPTKAWSLKTLLGQCDNERERSFVRDAFDAGRLAGAPEVEGMTEEIERRAKRIARLLNMNDCHLDDEDVTVIINGLLSFAHYLRSLSPEVEGIRETIEELAKLEAEATPGDWFSDGDLEPCVSAGDRRVAIMVRQGRPGRYDARLIAAMRNALPALLRALKGKG